MGKVSKLYRFDLDKTYCSECAAGEHYKVQAEMKVQHPNPDYYDIYPNLRVTKLICEDHLTMLTDDWGDECVVVEDYRQQLIEDACEHNREHTRFRELSVAECNERGIRHWGMCWHVYECTLCGKVYGVDSSG